MSVPVLTASNFRVTIAEPSPPRAAWPWLPGKQSLSYPRLGCRYVAVAYEGITPAPFFPGQLQMRKPIYGEWLSPILAAAKDCIPLSAIDTNPQPIATDIYHKNLYRKFALEIQNGLSAFNTTTADNRAIRLAAGIIKNGRPAHCIMSHSGVRRRAGELLCERLLPAWSDTPERSWFFGTFISDVGNTLEATPSIELGRLRRDVRKMLELTGMHAIGVVELQLARYPLKGRGRTIQVHVHTIGYVDQDTPTIAAADKLGEQLAEAISSRSTLSNWLGAPVARFRQIPNRARLAAYCAYLFKAPLNESWLVKEPRMRSGYRTRSHGQVDGKGALRLTEILSRLTLRSATLAHGDLVRPKGEWIGHVKDWCAERPIRNEPDFEAAFRRVRVSGRPNTSPEIRTDGRASVDLGWRVAMADMFAAVAENRARYDAQRSLNARPKSRPGVRKASGSCRASSRPM